jgi:hypothetical protein
MMAVKEAQAIAAVRFWPLANMVERLKNSAFGVKRTCAVQSALPAQQNERTLSFGRFALLRMLSHLGGTSQPIELVVLTPMAAPQQCIRLHNYSEKLVFVSGAGRILCEFQ